MGRRRTVDRCRSRLLPVAGLPQRLHLVSQRMEPTAPVPSPRPVLTPHCGNRPPKKNRVGEPVSVRKVLKRELSRNVKSVPAMIDGNLVAYPNKQAEKAFRGLEL